MAGAVSAQPVILHLKSGDLIKGLILSENTNQVVISNAWVKALSVPLSEIANRETEKTAPTPTNAPSIAVQPAALPTTPPPQPKVVAAATPVAKPAAKPKGKWAGEASVGLDTIFGTRDSQDYSGHLKLTYALPYASDPKEFFRNTFDSGGNIKEPATRIQPITRMLPTEVISISGKNHTDTVCWARGLTTFKRLIFAIRLAPALAGISSKPRTS